MMPYAAFPGLKRNLNYNDHSKMFEQYENYLTFVKKNDLWNEEQVTDSVKKILDYYMGTPPATFEHKGNEYNSETFMKEVMKLNPGEYFSFMSTKEFPYNAKHELVEFDNWWHCNEYYVITSYSIHYTKLYEVLPDSGYSGTPAFTENGFTK